MSALLRARGRLAHDACAALWRSASSSAGDGATTSYLRNLDNGAEVYLVGTAHISKRSAEEVQRIMRTVKPSTVLVELCAARAKQLMAPPGGKSSHSMLSEVLRTLGAPGDAATKLLSLGMKGFYAAWKHAGLEPGLEFRVALTEAELLSATVVYGDQEATETLKKLAATIKLPSLLRMFTAPPTPPPELARVMSADASLEEAIERLKNRETVRAMVKFTRSIHPEATRVLLDERDVILADALRKCTGRVVGVVGLAHVDGIERRWAELNGTKAVTS